MYVNQNNIFYEFLINLYDLIYPSFQLLLVLLDYLPKAEPSEEEKGEGCCNDALTLLSSIKSDTEFNFIFVGLYRLLSSVPTSNNTYLPNSLKGANCVQEMLMLLWR